MNLAGCSCVRTVRTITPTSLLFKDFMMICGCDYMHLAHCSRVRMVRTLTPTSLLYITLVMIS